MTDISVTQHRARMVLGIKLTCQACQNKPAVDSCDNESCPFSFWINTLHKQKMFDISDLASDFCKYCFSKCSYRYPVCQNFNQAAGQCIRFVGKESAVTVPGSKSGLSEPANPVTRKDGTCQR